METISKRTGQMLHNPGWVSAIFGSTEYAWVWLIARVYIGWAWLDAGWGKLHSNAWMSGGTALQGYWNNAVAVPATGHPAVAFDWYRSFLQFLLDSHSYVWFAKFVAVGEFLVGIALIVGIVTGIAAFFGALMNWSYMLAGSASTNPIMGILAIGIIVAWKTAGWWGLDRVVLPYLGAPWQKGVLFGGFKTEPAGYKARSWSRETEQWVRILAGFGVALYALIALTGIPEIVLLLAAGVWVAITGLGYGYLTHDSRS